MTDGFVYACRRGAIANRPTLIKVGFSTDPSNRILESLDSLGRAIPPELLFYVSADQTDEKRLIADLRRASPEWPSADWCRHPSETFFPSRDVYSTLWRFLAKRWYESEDEDGKWPEAIWKMDQEDAYRFLMTMADEGDYDEW